MYVGIQEVMVAGENREVSRGILSVTVSCMGEEEFLINSPDKNMQFSKLAWPVKEKIIRNV